MQEKLVGLFKAIYEQDADLDEIKRDAFECMKQQQIRGNICPLIKNAIQKCILQKKEGIDKMWRKDLVVTVDNKQQLKSVGENPKAYGGVLQALVDAHQLYEKSVDQIVEVWQEMLNSSKELKKTFYLLIMTEFSQTIWADENMRIIIDEIKEHQDELQDYKEMLVDFHEIDQKLNSAKLGAYINSAQQEDVETTASECSDDYGHDTCNRCHKPQLNKKSKKKKGAKGDGKLSPEVSFAFWNSFVYSLHLLACGLSNYVLAGCKKQNSGKSKKNKGKKEAKK